MIYAVSSIPRSLAVLVIEPARGQAVPLQEWLPGCVAATLDLALAASLREGLHHLCTHRVDVVLMDLVLPDYKGPDAVRAVRSAAPRCAVVAIGPMADEAVLQDALRAGAHEVLPASLLTAPAVRAAVERALIRVALASAASAATPALKEGTGPRIVHDLNNAITSVNGFADLLLARLAPGDPARASAEQVRAAGSRAAALVRSLADLSNEHSTAPATRDAAAHAA